MTNIRGSIALLILLVLSQSLFAAEHVARRDKIRVGLASLRRCHDIGAGVENIKATLQACSEQHVAIVCFPETYLSGLRGADRDLPPVDQPAMERAIAEVAAACRENKVTAIVGVEWQSERGLENRAIVIDPSGRIIGHQTKNQITPGGESENYVPDGNRQMFDVSGVKFGISICHEGWRYPETVRWAAVRGAKIVFQPQVTGSDHLEAVPTPEWGTTFYEKAMQCRAEENSVYFVSVNRAMKRQTSASSVIDPEGELVEFVPRGEEKLLVVDLDLKKATGLYARRFQPQLYEERIPTTIESSRQKPASDSTSGKKPESSNEVNGSAQTAPSPEPADANVRIAEEGNAIALIVTGDQPSPAAKEGAAILVDYLREICGARFEVVIEGSLADVAVTEGRIQSLSQPAHRTFILVGESQLTQRLGVSAEDLGPGSLLIRTFPNSVVLLGPDQKTPTDQNGSRYAVTTFLEDALGCRFLWPGDLGKVIPKRKTIDIDRIDQSFTPTIKQRRIRMAAGYGDRKAKGVERLGFKDTDYLQINAAAMQTSTRDGGWAGWHRLGGSLRLAAGHSFGYMWEKHKDAHPEWFAVQSDGTRDQSRNPDRSRLCVSNMELIEEIARDRIERLSKSDVKSVSIGPNDGGQTSFCRCEECRKLDPPNSRELENGSLALTDRYVYFWNEIAKRVVRVHSNAWLTADAYSVYSAPPVLRKLHPNIDIRYVGMKYNNDEKRKQDRDDWDAWSKAVRNIYFRPNLLLSGRRQGTPMVYVHKLAEDMQYMAHNSLIGTDFDSCCHHWATQGLNYYACAKLHWNPDLDADELIDDFCRSGFGAGADSVRKYFHRVEEITNRMASKQLGYTELYTPKLIDELRGYLEEATTATKDERDAHSRVAFVRSGLEYTDAYVAAFRIIRKHQARNPDGGRLPNDTKQRIRAALDNNWLVSRDVFEHHHLAVNVATVAWGSWAYFARFGWSDPSPEVRRQAESR